MCISCSSVSICQQWKQALANSQGFRSQRIATLQQQRRDGGIAMLGRRTGGVSSSCASPTARILRFMLVARSKHSSALRLQQDDFHVSTRMFSFHSLQTLRAFCNSRVVRYESTWLRRFFSLHTGAYRPNAGFLVLCLMVCAQRIHLTTKRNKKGNNCYSKRKKMGVAC